MKIDVIDEKDGVEDRKVQTGGGLDEDGEMKSMRIVKGILMKRLLMMMMRKLTRMMNLMRMKNLIRRLNPVVNVV